MGMVVRTNSMAINANRQLGMNQTQVSKSLEKLSSGFKINRAADDASGLAISEKMKAQIKGLDQAAANSQDGISLIQTAEGATTEIHDMLNRMVELATKSANGTIQDEVDREAIQREVDDLNSEITRISKSTNFNGINLLDGTLGMGGSTSSGSGIDAFGISGTVAMTATDTDEVKAKSVATLTGSTSLAAGDKFEVTLTNQKTGETKTVTVTMSTAGSGAAASNATAVADSINNDSSLNGMFKASASGGDVTIESLDNNNDWSATKLTGQGTSSTAFSASGSVGGTYTAGTAAYTTLAKKDDAGAAAAYATGDLITINGKKFEVVANEGDKPTKSGYSAVALGGSDADLAKNLSKLTGLDITSTGAGELKVRTSDDDGSAGGPGLTLQIGDTSDDFNKVTVKVDNLSAAGIGTAGLDVSNQTAAGNAIKTIKDAINQVSTNRANLGSLQNRLEHTINNLNVTSENMTAANSAIRDTDMAKEMMNYTKMNVLTQAAQAMLAQANQQPQAILQLLQ